jgi:hypothetical protein
MSRRQQASRVTIGTLIEAARKVKRPDLKRLRQMRRNGRELSSEELALVCEVFEVDPKDVTWVNPVLAELMDPSMNSADVQFTVEEAEDAERMYSGKIAGKEVILACSDYNDNRLVKAVPVFFALMNPSMSSTYIIETMEGRNEINFVMCWPYMVRNPSLFLSMMESPSIPWKFVDAALILLNAGMINWSFFEGMGKHSREKVVRWTKGDDLRRKAALYASALEWVSREEETPWEGEVEELDEEDSSTWRHMEKRKIGDIQSKGPIGGVVDWAAHARVINLILPYFEDMNRLGIFR